MIFNQVKLDQMAIELRAMYPNGPCANGGSELGATRELVSTAVRHVSDALKKSGKSIHLAIESDKMAEVLGLIIDSDVTDVIPMQVSNSLVRLDGRAIFLGKPEGAANFMRAVLREVEKTVETAREQA